MEDFSSWHFPPDSPLNRCIKVKVFEMVVTPPVMFFSKCQHIAQDAIADIFSL